MMSYSQKNVGYRANIYQPAFLLYFDMILLDKFTSNKKFNYAKDMTDI